MSKHMATWRDWSRRRKVTTLVGGFILLAGVAIAAFFILAGWSGSVTPVAEDNILTVEAISAMTSGTEAAGCSEGSASVVDGKVAFSWSPTLVTLNGSPVGEVAVCEVAAEYLAGASNTDTLVLLGFHAPAGVTASPVLTALGPRVCGLTLAPDAVTRLFVGFETDGSAATFDDTIHGFQWMDQTSFDGSQCLPGWAP